MTYVYVPVLKLQVSLWIIIIIPMSSYTTYQNCGVQVNKLFYPEIMSETGKNQQLFM